MTETATDLPTVDLSECDQEPIHLLELVQGHGCLLVVGGDSLCVRQVSENARDLLGQSAEDVLGRPLTAVLDDLAVADLEALREDVPWPENRSIGFYARPRTSVAGGGRLRVTAHRRGGEGAERGHERPDLIVEVESVPETDEEDAELTYEAESIALASLTEGENLYQLLNQAVHGIAGLTDYDRVMAYMFHEDWSGEIVAECCNPDMTPFLGLRYPASDIPAQARQLYLSMLLRVIVDVDGLNVPMHRAPSAVGEPPLDLGGAILRSVSSYHIEYLRNMGVKATLVASLVVDGELWGLIACHHDTRKEVPWYRREAVSRVAARLSDRIADILSLQRTRVRRRSKRFLVLLGLALAENANPVHTLFFGTPRLSDVVRCQGLALVVGDRVVTCGEAPPVEVLPALMARAAEHAEDGRFVSHDLVGGGLFDDMPVGSSRGMLAVFPGDGGRLALACFRGEVVREVHWGGDPNKPVEVDGASQRLSPRKSFNLWRQVVHDQASPWEPWAIRLVSEIAEVLVRYEADNRAVDGLARAVQDQVVRFETSLESQVETVFAADNGLMLVEVTADENADGDGGGGHGNRVVAVNQTFRTRFDVDQDDIEGCAMGHVLRQLGLPKAIADLPRSGDMDVEWWSGESGHRTLQVHRRGLFAYVDGSARRAWVTYAFGDVTRFHRTRRALGAARDQAQARSRGRTEFLARLARELRGPLQAIQGYATLLENDDLAARPDHFKSFAHEIGNHSGTLLNLLNNILDLSRLDHGASGSAGESFDLTTMVAEICQQAATAAAHGGLVWEWHMPNEQILVQGDAGALRRAFETLVYKAIVVSPAGSTVLVRLTMERGGEPRLSVNDSGLGLSDEELLALQRPLEARPHDGTLNDDQLGSVSLALVRGLVDLHGGAIAVTSTPGSGTTVHVTLPRHRVLGHDNAPEAGAGL
ncbi:GAF domain-containing protein [Roseospira visakhapatnamensis]|uniref:histidine kinase n=1 Tax=Roseospira visakhapatnamensis TaxID=390880 RepID=A0A7W6RBM1_9PROT|nr:GAF domain-containing protein [Roseospira visakhapatnamensis]MBB4265425.1 light-regulated signal transduction histidine kinase (bacteriophytochrome) [Roseospira visakhapatnamensis]